MAKKKIYSKAFPDYTTSFYLLYNPPPLKCDKCRFRSCNVCGKDAKGLVYYRLKSDCVVHPLCAKLKREIREAGVNDSDGDVVFNLTEGQKGLKCDWCKEEKLKGTDTPGMYYVSKVKDQGTFHVFCLLEMGIEKSTTGSRLISGRTSSVASGNKAIVKKSKKYGLGKSATWFKMVKVLLKITLSVLFGDPTTVIASMVLELFG